MTLAERIEAVLLEHGPLPVDALAPALRKRRTDVLAALRSDSRFARSGRTKGSRWLLAAPVRSFDAAEAAVRWDCDLETATEIIFGDEGFLERGLVASLNGNGRVVVTAHGQEFFHELEEEAA